MIRYPGAEVGGWTVLFILAGTLISYLRFSAGNVGSGVLFASLPIACLLIWLDLRSAKWFIVAYLCVAIAGTVMMLVTKGFNIFTLARGITAAYVAHLFASWDGGPNSD